MNCAVKGCERPLCSNGYCSMHYQRVRAWGHPGGVDALRRHGSALDRMAGKFVVGDDCWEWIASKTTAGYGQLMVSGRPKPAHRLMYEAIAGPIPKGLELDHLCRNRACIRPDHLEPVTHRENMLRGSWGAATHCRNGHEWNEESIYWRTDGDFPSRQCRLCARERDRKRRPRKATR